MVINKECKKCISKKKASNQQTNFRYCEKINSKTQ